MRAAVVVPGAWEGFLEEVALSQASEMSKKQCVVLHAGPSLSEGTEGLSGTTAGARRGRKW